MATKTRFSSLSAWLLSFFAPSLYRDVGTRWRGIGLFYLFFLLAVCWLPIMYKNYNNITELTQRLLPVAQQMPDMSIKDGEFFIDEPMPFALKSDDLGKEFLIIDTTGNTDRNALPEGSVLIEKEKIVLKGFKDDPDTIRVIDIPDGLNLEINDEVIQAWAPKASHWAMGIGYVAALLISWVYRILLMFVYAAIGGIFFFDLVNHSLNYKALLRLSAVAMTPAIILGTVQSYFDYSFPYQGWAYFGVTLLYVLLGIVSNRVKVIPRQHDKTEPVDLNPN